MTEKPYPTAPTYPLTAYGVELIDLTGQWNLLKRSIFDDEQLAKEWKAGFYNDWNSQDRKKLRPDEVRIATLEITRKHPAEVAA